MSSSPIAVPAPPTGPTSAPGPGRAPDPVMAAKMQVRQLSTAPWLSQALYVVAKLGVADELVDGARPVAEIARATGAHADTLYRFLRALASVGVFEEPTSGVFALAPASEQLCSDRRDSMRAVVLMHGEQTFRAWANVMHTVATGQPAFDDVYGTSFYAYLADHPDAERIFNAAMGVSGQPPLVVDALDFSSARTIVDVGGGSGALLARVLERDEQLAGILLDLPDAVRGLREVAGDRVADRIAGIPGSFFDEIPAGDSYVLSRVLHNWGDEQARAILGRIRAVIPAGGRLYILDRLVPDVKGPHPAKISDLVMLVVLGGRDRTLPEYSALLESAGFAIESMIAPPRGSDPRAESAIVCTPVPSRESA